MHNSLSLSQFASVLGFNGLTLLIMTSNLGLARSLAEHSSRPLRSFGRVLALGSMWLACWLWGHYRVQTLEADFAQGRSTRVGLVQPNFTFDELSSRPERSASAQEQSLDNLLAQTERLMNDDGGNLDLVIWPESVAPSHFAQSEDQIELTRDLAMRSGTPILVQATAFDDAEVASKGYRRATIHSTSFLIRPDGSRSPSYRKWVPIPFGETVPFEEHFPELGDWLRDNVGNTSKVGRGTSFAALPYSPHDYVAPLICFDAIEPELPRLQTRYGGATLLVNQSNFVWMGRSAAGYQFKELVRMRAIENGRSAVLAANTGPSVIFSPVGRELTKTTPLLEVATLKADVPVSTITTPFSVWGRYPLHFFAVLGLVAIVIRMSSFGRRQPSRFFPL
jgi:apolipoprotein N-acyltransferase